MAKAARATAEMWQDRVDRWSASGLTAARFAAVEGLNQHTLAWWKCQLGKRVASKPSLAMSFVALQEAAPVAPAASEPFEVLLASGHRVRVPPEFDAAALARLIEALEGAGR